MSKSTMPKLHKVKMFKLGKWADNHYPGIPIIQVEVHGQIIEVTDKTRDDIVAAAAGVAHDGKEPAGHIAKLSKDEQKLCDQYAAESAAALAKMTSREDQAKAVHAAESEKQKALGQLRGLEMKVDEVNEQLAEQKAINEKLMEELKKAQAKR